jgi:uncharacterized membrane protein YtjA (UPF0391 family)
MFNIAMTSLIIAMLAAILGYGGLPDATLASLAQHVFLAAIALFVISAIAEILDPELLHLRQATWTRYKEVKSEASSPHSQESPHLSDRSKNVGEERLLLQHLGEALHQRAQPVITHARQ